MIDEPLKLLKDILEWDGILPHSKVRIRNVIRKAEEKIQGKNRKAVHTDGTISDGFGNYWSKTCAMCKGKTMEIVRPGKVQCSKCG